MGIKNLAILIKKFAPTSLSYKTINDYKGLTLGVDANLMLYKIVYAIRKNGYDIKSKDGLIVTTHVHGTLLKLKAFKKYNITPVFVFDGKPPKIKRHALKERERQREIVKQKYEMAKNKEDKKKYFYGSSDITDKEIDDMKQLIKLFGYSTVEAPQEADSQLGYMSYTGVISGVISDDMDILLFGGKKLLKNFTVSSKKKFVEIDLEKVKEQLKVTQKELINIGIISGCDYCGKLKDVGPITAYKKIKQLKSKVDKQVEEYFRKPVILNVNKIKITNNKIDKDKLTEFLKSFGYSSEQIDKLDF